MSNEKGTWGGKREGAGRKKEVSYTSKTQGIYCDAYELIRLKSYLAFCRCLNKNGLNGPDMDSGARRLKYGTICNWMFYMMEEEDWEDFRQCLKPGTVERLEKAYEKRLKKLEKSKEK